MTQEEFDVYGLSLEKEVMKTLQKKGARLTIAMAEACNTIIDIPTPKRYNAMNVNIGKRLEELFIYESGSLIASSSVIDQRSWTDDKDGGIYTNMFINALNEVISSDKKAKWETVFSLTTEYTKDYAKDIPNGQKPQFENNKKDTPIKLKSSSYIAPKVKLVK